jgi:midasin
LDPTAEDVEGSTEFTDVEGGGFDEGEGAQNVSKGNEDLKEQLENANKSSEQDAEKEEQKSGEDGDDDGIEMDFDFDGQIEDVGKDDEENPNNSEGEETEEISEKMGDLGNDPGDVLDKNIWDPKDDEDKTEDLQELPDASVEGTDTRDDPEVVAKDKNELVSDEQNDKPPSPKEGEIDPLPDDWEMKEDGIDPSDDGDDDKPGAEHDVNEREIEGSDSQSINEEENGEDKEGVEKVTDENNEPAEDGDDTLEEKLSSEMSQPGEDSNGQDKENDDIHPPEDQLGTDVPEDQVSYQQSMPNTSSVQSDSTMSTSLQGSFDPNQEQSSAEQSHFGRETVSPRETSSEDVGKQKVPKCSRSSPPSRTPVPRESLPSAKRVKLSKEHSNAQSEEKDQKQESSLYSHVEDESVWDEQALDSAVLGQEGTQPVLEDIEDDNDESDAVEEMDVEDTERERMAEESIKRVAAKEMPVPSEEEQKGDLSEGGEENSDTESDGDEMEMETDSRELSFYHFSTDHYQDTSRTAQQDSEAVLKMVEESTLLLQNEDESTVDSTELWSKYEMLTSELSQSLYESIRITFEPTLATQFKGDFRSGKRLNIRRLIPYIASHYQNDRIWLRRSKPSKMNYQVLVAVDDSSSMAENKCRLTAFKSLAAISGALGRLEGVSFGICRFGNSVDVLKRFGEYMTTEGGGFVLKNMTFQQKRTNFVKLLKHSTAILSEEQRLSLHQSRGGRNQLLIVLSDGRGVFMDGAQAIEKAVRELNEEGIFSVFIILDPLQKDSVLSIRIPVFRQGEVPSFKSYLEAFPFPYYIILKDIESLPSVLGESLQQWFQLVNEATK